MDSTIHGNHPLPPQHGNTNTPGDATQSSHTNSVVDVATETLNKSGIQSHDSKSLQRHNVTDISIKGTENRGISIKGTENRGISIKGTDKEQRAINIKIGGNEGLEKVATTQVGAALQSGHNIFVKGNHYFDPISCQMLTLQYRGEVAKENYGACTQALVSAAIDRMELFFKNEAFEREGFKQSMSDIKSYSFDYRRGEIHITFHSGVSYSLACGMTLRDAIKPFLKEQEDFEKLPSPSEFESGLKGITPPLEPIVEAFVHRLAFDPYSIHRLEIAINELRNPKQPDYNSPRKAEYQLLLNLIRGLRNGAKFKLSDKDNEKILKLVQRHTGIISRLARSKRNKSQLRFYIGEAINSIKGGVIGLVESKLDKVGNPLLGKALESLNQELDAFNEKPHWHDHGITLTLSDAKRAASFSTLITQKKEYLNFIERGLANQPTIHTNVDIAHPPKDWSEEGEAVANEATLHLEPEINLQKAKNKAPIWAKVTTVTCQLEGNEGDASDEAIYTHFVLHNNEWWKLENGKAEKVKWSRVQKMATRNAIHVGLEIKQGILAQNTPLTPQAPDEPMQKVQEDFPKTQPANFLQEAELESPRNSTEFSQLLETAPPTQDQEVSPILTNLRTGTVRLGGEIGPCKWSLLDDSHPHIQAMKALRSAQGRNLADNDHRDMNLWRRFYPALQPELQAKSKTLFINDEKLSPESQKVVIDYFDTLGKNINIHEDNALMHSLPRVINYHDLQLLADASGFSLIVHTGPKSSDELKIDPKSGSSERSLRFAAPGLSGQDPDSSCRLTPLLPSEEISELEQKKITESQILPNSPMLEPSTLKSDTASLYEQLSEEDD